MTAERNSSTPSSCWVSSHGPEAAQKKLLSCCTARAPTKIIPFAPANLTEKKKVHFLKITLIGSISNRDGLGATVKVRAGGKVYTQFHDGKSGYLSQSSIP